MRPITPTPTGVQILVHVQPRAARSACAGLHGDALKIRLAAPPVDGQANDGLIHFLATNLGVPARAVTILSGHTGRRKRVEVAGVTPAEAERRLTGGTEP